MKLFAVSDIHGFYNEFRKALDTAGFVDNDESMQLIVCGDVWDRGPQPREVMDYLMGLTNCVLVRGNHEDLFEELCQRGYPCEHDYSNGTVNTVADLARATKHMPFLQASIFAEQVAKPFLDKFVNYYESANYIFVHSWIPVKNMDGLPAHYTYNRKFEVMENWREAHAMDWADARWGDPFNMAERGLLPNKTIVFGHWATSKMWANKEGRSKYGADSKHDIWYGDGYIGIDATTAVSGKVNVLVLEDELL